MKHGLPGTNRSEVGTIPSPIGKNPLKILGRPSLPHRELERGLMGRTRYPLCGVVGEVGNHFGSVTEPRMRSAEMSYTGPSLTRSLWGDFHLAKPLPVSPQRLGQPSAARSAVCRYMACVTSSSGSRTRRGDPHGHHHCAPTRPLVAGVTSGGGTPGAACGLGGEEGPAGSLSSALSNLLRLYQVRQQHLLWRARVHLPHAHARPYNLVSAPPRGRAARALRTGRRDHADERPGGAL